jgi:PAS domain S-box-containing protein
MLQQALLGQAVDTADVLVFVADEKMRYIAVNQHACEVLGYTREELLALTVTDVSAEVEAPALYRQMISDRSQRGVSSIRCKDGTLLEFHYTATETRVSGLPYYVSIGTVAAAS